jgi:hypothetical protein
MKRKRRNMRTKNEHRKRELEIKDNQINNQIK